jgi:predicted transcriptional regulator
MGAVLLARAREARDDGFSVRSRALGMDMQAITEVSGRGSIFKTAAAQVAAARTGRAPDFHLSFESARSLFAELAPARLDLLDTLRRVGPCSVYALAKASERNDSNVHTDVARMEELGLIDRTEAGEILVPYESVGIIVPLARAVA